VAGNGKVLSKHDSRAIHDSTLFNLKGATMRAIDCPCGHRLEGADDDEPAGGGEQGDDHNRRPRRAGVGGDPGDQRAEHEAEVAP